ncbi:MAG: thioredoxin [Marinobacter sp.]
MTKIIQHLNDSNFNDTIKGSAKPVLVDFWAEWCGPCHAIAPLLEELADEFVDELSVAKVNVDENPDLAAATGIRGIPALVIYRDGKPAARHAGTAKLGQLRSFISEAL